MKKTIALFVLFFCLLVGTACAAVGTEDQSLGMENKTLPRVMVLYINNAKTDYNGEIDTKIMDHLKTLAANRWILVPGDVYKDKLSAMGYQSVTVAEREDIIMATKGSEADAVLLMEVEPFGIRDVMTFFTIGKKVTASIPVKVIDLSTKMYLYNGKFVELGQDNTMFGGIGNKSVIMKTIDQVFGKFDMIIPEKLVNVKHVDTSSEESSK